MTTTDGVRAALAWLATYGLHSTLFLGGAWLLCRLRPPRVNRNRERIWKLALLGGLVSATLQPSIGTRPLLGHIDWLPAESARAAMRDDAVRDAEAPPGPGDSSAEASPSSTGPGSTAGAGAIAPALASAAPAVRAPATAATRARRAPDHAPAAGPAAAGRAEAPPLVLASGRGTEHQGPQTSPAGTPEPGTRGPLQPLVQSLREPSVSWSSRWPGLALAGWIAVGFLGVAGLLGSWTCLRRRMLGRRFLEQGELVEMLERLRLGAKLRRRVRLSVSTRVAAPFSTGLLRPEVCLPAAVLTELDRAQQQALLAHELAHLMRRDPAWFGVGFLIEKLFFFQPLNRLARRQLAELAEVACDDWAVRWTGARLALASCLTEVAGWVIGERPRLLAPPGLAGHRSRLGMRVTRLLDDRRSPAGEPPAPWWPPLAAGALAFAALAVPGVSAAEPRVRSSRAAPVPPAERPTPAEPLLPEHARGREEARPLAPQAPAAVPEGLGTERGVLESELTLLEVELASLHAELEVRALRTRFAAELERIDARMSELRAQQRRVGELLARLAAPNTPALGTMPSAADPAPTAPPTGNSRGIR